MMMHQNMSSISLGDIMINTTSHGNLINLDSQMSSDISTDIDSSEGQKIQTDNIETS